LHLAADRVPHQDIASRPFEMASGVVCVGLLAVRRGPFDPVALGAFSASAPDLEHVFTALRPRGEKLFHRGRGWHRPGGLPAGVQILLAGVIVGLLLSPRKSRPPECG
jgi:hypothetical protein